MNHVILLILFYGCFPSLRAEPLPSLSDEEKSTVLVLKTYLGELKDPRVPELEKQISNYAATLQSVDEFSRAEYRDAVKRNGGWLLDGDAVKQLALGGNVGAQLQLAIAYMVGQNADEGIYGIPKDEQQATFWVTKAALNGNCRAQWILSMRKDTSFDNVVYWLLKAAGHATQRSFKMAAMTINIKAHLNDANIAQLQQEGDYQKTLSSVEQTAGNALVLLNNIRQGKSAWGDRTLTPDEMETAAKYLSNGNSH